MEIDNRRITTVNDIKTYSIFMKIMMVIATTMSVKLIISFNLIVFVYLITVLLFMFKTMYEKNK